MKIWLVGMMASGKTTAGRLAAASLDVAFFDTDELVADEAGTSIAELWAERGEEAFREAERAMVARLEPKQGIVATGGGVVLDEANRMVLTRSGTVAWLDASPMVLASRAGGSAERPLLAGSDNEAESVLSETLAERASLYSEVADHRLETDGVDPETIAGWIEALWKS